MIDDGDWLIGWLPDWPADLLAHSLTQNNYVTPPYLEGTSLAINDENESSRVIKDFDQIRILVYQIQLLISVDKMQWSQATSEATSTRNKQQTTFLDKYNNKTNVIEQ